jgi:hypothetical protein
MTFLCRQFILSLVLLFFFNLWFLNFRSTGFGRNESSSQPGNTLDDEDIELPDEDEDALEDDE